MITLELITLAAIERRARTSEAMPAAGRGHGFPDLWFHNVEYAVTKKVGRETVSYVSSIYKYYVGWELMAEQKAARARAKQLAAK